MDYSLWPKTFFATIVLNIPFVQIHAILISSSDTLLHLVFLVMNGRKASVQMIYNLRG